MRYAGLLLLCLLAACVNGNKRLDALPYTYDKVDGSYRGWMHTWAPTPPHRWWLTNTYDGAKCPHTSFGIFEISDRVLNVSYTPGILFEVPVQADGTLSEVVGKNTLLGSVKKGKLIFTIRTPVCVTRVTGQFYLNHS